MDPSIGRIVHFYSGATDALAGEATPQAAIVTYVHSAIMVNLAVFDHNGGFHSRTSVELVPLGSDAPAGRSYATWPPRT